MRQTIDRSLEPCAEGPVRELPLALPTKARVRFVDDRALVEGVRAGNPVAMTEFYDRFALSVERILWGILGPDHELADLHHDVFVRALASIDKLQEPDALRGWMNTIAVHTAKACLEKRVSRRRWQSGLAPDVVPEPGTADPGGQLDAREVLRAVHTVLDHLALDERVAFALRHIEGLELVDVARACDVSLATIKRRLSRAEAEFESFVHRSPLLSDQLQKGNARWTRG
jgi:RNA polymerase sigma-70 factor, ECF subfamily